MKYNVHDIYSEVCLRCVWGALDFNSKLRKILNGGNLMLILLTGDD
jgi:hypothetical protein